MTRFSVKGLTAEGMKGEGLGIVTTLSNSVHNSRSLSVSTTKRSSFFRLFSSCFDQNLANRFITKLFFSSLKLR